MSPVILGEPRSSVLENSTQVSTQLCVDGEEHEIYYTVGATSPLQTGGEIVFPLGLLTALFRGEDLYCKSSVSERLLGNVNAIQELWCTWVERPHITVHAPARAASATLPQGVASFFSGGIDSFYSTFKHRDEITHLIVVWGFDVPSHNSRLRDKVAPYLRRAAGQLGKPLIEVHTNLREFSNRHLSWDVAHGPALAGIALLLSTMFRKVFVPGSWTYGALRPWGTHPMLDPLWSSDEMSLVSDGWEASRFEKLAVISKNDIVLETLRVCWSNPQNAYNCGECQKCLQAMAMLRALGLLRRATTFPQKLNLRAMSEKCSLGWQHQAVRLQFERSLRKTLNYVESSGHDRALAVALRDCLNEKYGRGIWPAWNRFTGLLRSIMRKATT
jgi:hypothetical protein